MPIRKRKEKSRIFAEKAKGGFLASVSQFVGYLWILVSVCILIGMALQALFRNTGLLNEQFYLLLAGCAAAFFLILWGRSTKDFVKRYRYYRNVLEGRDMISFEEMASLTGKKVTLLKKDIKRLLRQGTLLQGHLDEELTCLFLTIEAYDQYVRLGRVKRASARNEEETHGEESSQTKTLKEIGEEYLLVFENYLKKIESKEVQKCIADIGAYSVRILSYEGANDQADRFLSYYFPATEKLLKDYEELEREAIASEGQDVLDMLNTVRYSFQSFSEKLAEGKRTDVETDILALEMMLSKE